MSNNVYNPDDFLTAVSEGEVSGYSLEAVVCRNMGVNATLQDIWGEGGTMTQPTGAESYEIVSNNINDTAAGTGMQQVLVQTRGATGLTEFQSAVDALAHVVQFGAAQQAD